ncbi:MAG: aminotransferase class V-fold PLP-dependent enzyme [Acetobacteraceae bacterium]|jgi:alanine-glyoxylate transaminase/serine-glyoxylate transaminase/serine-pyruvate transaminase
MTQHHAGRHFLQIPGPTNVPDRVLRAIDSPTIDHRGPAFGHLGLEILTNLRAIFQTSGPVVIYPASGTGAWEAALTNTLSPGDTVLMCRTGWFATLWNDMALRLGLAPAFIDTDWRRGADVDAIGAALADDRAHRIKAVCVVHNETSTGCTSRIDEVRRVMDAAGHPALLMVDTISSLASLDYRHDEWGVDVTIAGSQKGLMLPPGLSFNAISERALTAAKSARLPRSYWDWGPMLEANKTGYFPYTPGTNLLFGLNEAVKMLLEEGLPNVFARHDRHAEATRRAVRSWGLEVQCADPRHYSSSLTAVRVPAGHSADALRAIILDKYNMSLGNGLGILKDQVFRIGHLGDFGDLQLIGTLGGVEMGLRSAGVPHKPGGVQGALNFLAGNA